MSESATIWEGAEALRPFLVPLDNLAPFPGNPRRGDVAQLRGSLRRFGQVLPALADPALEDGDLVRIIARHHLALAATEEGWTHIAVIPHEFADETEARAYLLADNRLGELGGYNEEELVAHLKHLAELDALPGTGYTGDDVDYHMARLRELQQQNDSLVAVPPAEASPLPSDMQEVVLVYSQQQRQQFEVWLKIVQKERDTGGISETCYEALRLAAQQLNLG